MRLFSCLQNEVEHVLGIVRFGKAEFSLTAVIRDNLLILNDSLGSVF
jgi:hypothetical protein